MASSYSLQVMDSPSRIDNRDDNVSTLDIEDSPVFSFLNSLSPIKPIRSTHIHHHQTTNILSVVALPSVFGSPRVNNSFNDSRFIPRQSSTKLEFSSRDGGDGEKENLDPRALSKHEIGESQGSNFAHKSSSITPFVEEGHEIDNEAVLGDAQSSLFDGDSLDLTPESQNQLLACKKRLAAEFQDVMPCSPLENKQLSVVYGDMRRCLVFEPVVSHFEHSGDCGSDSSLLPQPVGNSKQQLQAKRHSHSPLLHQLLPAIGLRLNALAASASERLRIGNDSLISSSFVSSNPELMHNTFNYSCVGREVGSFDNFDPYFRDPFEELGIVIGDFGRSSSPSKKRMKIENPGGGEACKRCNCKKSKCLKLYCDCFAAGVYCMEPCACLNCFNKPAYKDIVHATREQIESRNPFAFAPKVISDSQLDAVDVFGKTPTSARHKRGCNCKRSGCLKKYCECYQSGVGCSSNCRCEACRNSFGMKDDSRWCTIKDTQEAMNMTDKELQSSSSPTNASALHGDLNLNLKGDSPSPLTIFSSTARPLKSSVFPKSARLPIGIPQQIKVSCFLIAYKRDCLWGGTTKSSSPSGKRVSPPQVKSSGRRLRLESICSFPSLC